MSKRWGSALTGSALLVGLTVAIATPASAATPPWQPDPNASLGSIAFYDAAGNVITQGTNLNHLFDYAMASTVGRAGTTKATATFAFPDHTKSDTTTWFQTNATASTNYPNAAAPDPVKTSPNPVATAEAADANLQALLNTTTLDSTAGYANIVEIRIKDSGPGLPIRKNPFWATDISYDATAGTWQQVYPAPTTTQTTTTTLAVSPAGHAAPGSDVTLTARIAPSTAAGTVQFKDGANNLGLAADVSAGTASLTTTALAAGSHSLTAVFTPSNATSFTGSTSPAVTYQVVADASSLTISKSATIAYGKSTKIAAKLTDGTTHANISGASITLLSRTSTAKPFTMVKSATTTSTGAASLTVAPKTKTYYEWKYAGSAAHAAKTSASGTVSVAQVVTAAAKATKPKKNAKFKVYGTVAPSLKKLKVTLQQKVGGKWKTIATTKTKSQKLPTGKKKVGFVFTLKEKKKGKFSFRVTRAATSTLSAGTSKTLKVHVV